MSQREHTAAIPTLRSPKRAAHTNRLPAEAGIHVGNNSIADKWVPVFAGTTAFMMLL
jgi:hypothetical protein